MTIDMTPVVLVHEKPTCKYCYELEPYTPTYQVDNAAYSSEPLCKECAQEHGWCLVELNSESKKALEKRDIEAQIEACKKQIKGLKEKEYELVFKIKELEEKL
jgi:hypothetical protein